MTVSTRHPLRRLRSECGQAVVEFALVLPLLAVVLFGIVDFGISLNAWNNVTQLAGSGARRAAVNHDAAFSPVTYVCDAAEPIVRESLRVGVALPGGSGVGQPVEITTEAAHDLVYQVPATSITLHGKATMRLEAPATFSATGLTACP